MNPIAKLPRAAMIDEAVRASLHDVCFLSTGKQIAEPGRVLRWWRDGEIEPPWFTIKCLFRDLGSLRADALHPGGAQQHHTLITEHSHG